MKKNLFFVSMIILVLAMTVCSSARSESITFKKNSGLTVKDGTYVIGLPINTDVSEVERRAVPEITVSTSDTVVKTGDTIHVKDYGFITSSATAVIKGDLDGNGKIQSIDYLKIKKHFAGSLLEGIYFVAGDINGDNEIKSGDYLSLKKYFKGGYELYTPLPEMSDEPTPAPTANPNPLAKSVDYSNIAKNLVQVNYENNRTIEKIENGVMVLRQGIMGEGEKYVHSFENKNGGVYFTDTCEPYLDAEGKDRCYFRDGKDVTSAEGGSYVSRDGYYFYDAHIRNVDFKDYQTLKMNLIYNTLPDSLRITCRLNAIGNISRNITLGHEFKIEASTVEKLEILDKNGTHTDIANLDESSIEYAAFDVKGAGVVAAIYATDCTADKVSVTLEDGYYVVRTSKHIGSVTEGTVVLMSYQLYNDDSHDFAGVRRAAYQERHPASVTVDFDACYRVKSVNSVGYDSNTGMYKLDITSDALGMTIKEEDLNKYNIYNISVENDGHERPVYIWVKSNTGGSGGAILKDNSNNPVAVPIEVCRSFGGDNPGYEEDYGFGDQIFPLYMNADEKETCNLYSLNLCWGAFPQQTVASIEYAFQYLIQSTYCSETTCIAPLSGGAPTNTGKYIVDFRGVSEPMWETQSQHNSTGAWYFTCLNNARVGSLELNNLKIKNAGPTYGEINMNYMAPSGDYEVNINTLEFPQDDETRNYYTVEMTFVRDTTIRNIQSNLQIITYLTPTAWAYSYGEYLDEDGKAVTMDGVIGNTVHLNKDGGYFALYRCHKDSGNTALIVKDFDVTYEGGKKWEGNPAIKIWDNTCFALTIGAKTLNFKAGDKIKMNFILLPNGDAVTGDATNARNVYQDSVVNPFKITATKGSVVNDTTFMPTVIADGNEAEFTLSGSRNNNTVRIDGFKNNTRPVVEEFVDGSWVVYNKDVLGNDSYMAHFNEDNTYGFSFVVDMGTDNNTTRQFRVSQK